MKKSSNFAPLFVGACARTHIRGRKGPKNNTDNKDTKKI